MKTTTKPPKAKSSAQLFVEEIEAFMKETGCTPTKIGRGIERPDPGIIQSLREGRIPGLDLVDRIHAFMHAYRQTLVKKPVVKGVKKA